MPLLRRQALSDDVYDAIKSQLLSNQLPPGGRLNIDELRRDLGVSNTPIRQALSRLEAEGLVVKEPFRGYTANDFLGLERLLQVYELRGVLEPGVAALAAVRRSEDQVEELAALAVMPQVGSTEELDEAVQIASDMDTRFHVRIAECTANPQLAEEVHRVHERHMPFRYFTRHVSDRTQANEEHLAIVAAIRSGDGPAAAEAMRRHISRAVARVVSRANESKRA